MDVDLAANPRGFMRSSLNFASPIAQQMRVSLGDRSS